MPLIESIDSMVFYVRVVVLKLQIVVYLINLSNMSEIPLQMRGDVIAG
jgi:hypothetical protein